MAAGEGSHASPGAVLRAHRIAAGCSLQEMAQITRIRVGQLEALEADDFAALPAPVFVNGFIRAYCDCLDVSPGEALSLYRTTLVRNGGKRDSRPSATRRRASWVSHPIVLSAVLFVAFGGGLLALDATGRHAAHRVSSVAVQPVRAGAGRATGVPMPSPAELGRGGLQRLVVRAIEATWIRVQTDEGRVITKTLPAGATREWSSGRGFVLATDNAGGLQVALNGQPLPPLGARGMVIRRLSLPDPPPGS